MSTEKCSLIGTPVIHWFYFGYLWTFEYIYNVSKFLPINTTNSTIEKCAKSLDKHFTKEDNQMVSKHENMLNLIIHQENENQNHSELTLHTHQ